MNFKGFVDLVEEIGKLDFGLQTWRISKDRYANKTIDEKFLSHAGCLQRMIIFNILKRGIKNRDIGIIDESMASVAFTSRELDSRATYSRCFIWSGSIASKFVMRSSSAWYFQISYLTHISVGSIDRKSVAVSWLTESGAENGALSPALRTSLFFFWMFYSKLHRERRITTSLSFAYVRPSSWNLLRMTILDILYL